MKLSRETADVYVPDGISVNEALNRITHMGVGAHQDDLEIMAIEGILACYNNPSQWFAGVTVTNGSGSPRAGIYEKYDDEEMQAVRQREQQRAAHIGGYGIQIQLDHSSSAVKEPGKSRPVIDDLMEVLTLCRPRVIYTHALVEQHVTHQGVTLRLIESLRELGSGHDWPQKFIACEVWLGHEWLTPDDQLVMDVSAHKNLQAALLGVYDSQIEGGKRYDLAAMGRREANATYNATHGVDTMTGMVYGVDLMALINNPNLDPVEFVDGLIKRFAKLMAKNLRSLIAS